MHLRLLTPDDLDALVDLDSDPEVMRFITGGPPTPREVYADQIFPRWLAIPAERPGMGFFAIEIEGRFQGWALLRPDTFQPEWAEVGYRLRREAWGRGIATAAARTLMTRAFDELGADVVSARTTPDNLGSRRVMERLGMRLEGTCVFPARSWGTLQMPEWDGVVYVRRRLDGDGTATTM